MSRACIGAVGVLAVLAGAGCADPPEERLAGAWRAAELQEEGAFVGFFTARSAELLGGLRETAERTRGDLAYVKSVTDLLPKGEIVEVKLRDNLALVTVKGSGDRYDVRLLKERGEWRVDVFGLPALWAPLAERVEL